MRNFILESLLNVVEMISINQLINEFNQSEFTLMINILFRRSQDENLLIKLLNSSLIYSNEGYSQIETEISCLIPKLIYIDNITVAQEQQATKEQYFYTLLYLRFNFCGLKFLVIYQMIVKYAQLNQYFNTQLPYNLYTYFEHFGLAYLNFISKIFNYLKFIDQIQNSQKLKKISTKVVNDYLTPYLLYNLKTNIIVQISILASIQQQNYFNIIQK
ncbi:unnamed protein product [Paramecium primaurelia]|uniref:Transmembrane protein n=1 Tax=Paramecium primaurelia TaxID=5886 RepID=A0A8S1Q541_PARPR|nr:unnamed protein product [Paramecium primaurelia]